MDKPRCCPIKHGCRQVFNRLAIAYMGRDGALIALEGEVLEAKSKATSEATVDTPFTKRSTASIPHMKRIY